MNNNLDLDDAEYDLEAKLPMKRLGSTRKLMAFNHIRLQLNEQLKHLDSRVEAQTALAGELQDYFKKRADVEQDYSRGLDKLARTLQLRHREQKHKREQWPLFSSYSCWQTLISATKTLARDHAALAELYSGPLAARLATAAEDVQRVYRVCREIGYESHEEILRVLSEVHAAGKAHQTAAGEWRIAATKLRQTHVQRHKFAAQPRNKKLKIIDKEIEKRRMKHADAKLKALKARSDYLLSLEAANATIHKYFVDDLSDLIDCMDLGFNNCISRALRLQASADHGRAKSLHNSAEILYATLDALDSRLDKQKFFESHHQAFQMPKKIAYQGQPPDEEDIENMTGLEDESDSTVETLKSEMETKLAALETRVRSLRAAAREACKTLDSAEDALRRLHEEDCESSDTLKSIFVEDQGEGTSHDMSKYEETHRSQRQETEYFYLNKFREYLSGGGRLTRLEARSRLLRGGGDSGTRVRRCGAGRGRGLWSATLSEHVARTGQPLPPPLTSAIRVIAKYGLTHQGVFRVSGSQAEISSLRARYERGRDPLATRKDASDLNSVAGLLKLYLRELRPPLIPIVCLDHLLQLAQIENEEEFISGANEFIIGLPKYNMIVLRYLFAFLSHLSEYSEKNMMDSWNLAICFGPTLLPVPDEREQVHTQNLLNSLVGRFITNHLKVFPQDAGPLYDKSQQEVDENGEGEDTLDADSELSNYDDEDVPVTTPELEESSLLRLDTTRPIDNGPPLTPKRYDSLAEHQLPSINQQDDFDDEDFLLECDQENEIFEQQESDEQDSPIWKRKSSPALKHTPDLVLDLPAKPDDVSPASTELLQDIDYAEEEDNIQSTDQSPTDDHSTTADTFLTNQNNTLKKKPNKGCEASTTDCRASPVGARAMAAKFADLTLTGGSLKPSIAAKPTVLKKNHGQEE